MKIYVARQPIYNGDKSLFGYELLYRNSEKNSFSNVDEDEATRELTYNVLSEFDFNSLTNEKYGFINFTRQSIMSDLPLLFNPDKIIIEILENITIDEELVEKIEYLKDKKYRFALDDFIDDGTYDELLPFVDIIKVEYNLLEPNTRINIAKKYRKHKKLIAERIETEEEYENAVSEGYNLFQGYYFSKPIMMSTTSVNIATSTYIRLWNEISKEEPRFEDLERIIKVDAGLTYKLLSLMNTMAYNRGRQINSIKQALLRLGINETKKWMMLLFLRDISNTDNDEFTKISLIRAMFMEKIIVKLGKKHIDQDAYMVGLLSMIDNILNQHLIKILDNLKLSNNIKDALINKEGILFEILQWIKCYELSQWDKVEAFSSKYDLNTEIIAETYLESLKYADDMFKMNK